MRGLAVVGRRWWLGGKACGERRGLRVESAHPGAYIVEPVPDLDGDRLPSSAPDKGDIDRSGPRHACVDREFRQRRPAPRTGERDERALSTEMLQVARPAGAGRVLEEPDILLTDSSRHARPRLDRRAGAVPALEVADERLRQPGPLRHVDLGQCRRLPSIAKRRPKTNGHGRRTSPSGTGMGSGPVGSTEAAHITWMIAERPSPARIRGSTADHPGVTWRRRLARPPRARGRLMSLASAIGSTAIAAGRRPMSANYSSV